jgi:glycerate-2-kinase
MAKTAVNPPSFLAISRTLPVFRLLQKQIQLTKVVRINLILQARLQITLVPSGPTNMPYEQSLINAAKALLERAKDCFDLASKQHLQAESQHEIASRQSQNADLQQEIAKKQHVNADRIEAKAKKLEALGHTLTANATEISKNTAAILRSRE